MSDTTQFLSLWPTIFMRDRLPADQAITQALADEITRLDSERADLTTGYLEDNLLTSEHPAQIGRAHV